jgi:hypothetical protein
MWLIIMPVVSAVSMQLRLQNAFCAGREETGLA